MVETREDLEKLIKMLRKNGVESVKIGTIELKLGPYDPPPSKYMRRKAPPGEFKEAGGGGRAYTEADVLFWSSTPPGTEPGQDS